MDTYTVVLNGDGRGVDLRRVIEGDSKEMLGLTDLGRRAYNVIPKPITPEWVQAEKLREAQERRGKRNAKRAQRCGHGPLDKS